MLRCAAIDQWVGTRVHLKADDVGVLVSGGNVDLDRWSALVGT